MKPSEKQKTKERELEIEIRATGFRGEFFFNRLSCDLMEDGNWLVRVGFLHKGKVLAHYAFVITSRLAAQQKSSLLTYLARIGELPLGNPSGWNEPEDFNEIPAPEVINFGRVGDYGEIALLDFALGVALNSAQGGGSLTADPLILLKSNIDHHRNLIARLYEGSKESE